MDPPSCSLVRSTGSKFDYFETFICSCSGTNEPPSSYCLTGVSSALIIATLGILMYAIYNFKKFCVLPICRPGVFRAAGFHDKYNLFFQIIIVQCLICCMDFMKPNIVFWMMNALLHTMAQFCVALHMTPLGYERPWVARTTLFSIGFVFSVVLITGFILKGQPMCFYQLPWFSMVPMEIMLLCSSYVWLRSARSARTNRPDTILRYSTQLKFLRCCSIPVVAGIAYYGSLFIFARLYTDNCIVSEELDLTNFNRLLQFLHPVFAMTRYFILWVAVAFFLPILAEQEKSYLENQYLSLLRNEKLVEVEVVGKKTTLYGANNT